MLYTTSLMPVVLTFGYINHQQDVVGRILGGGVANRYNGRLLPVRTFLRDKIGTQVSGSGSVTRLLLRKVSFSF